mmetsp:Transcript_66284/g.158154  ORF Transcript_66284/g.158154 Transcript_66284/m.158154 type:complete len:654 (+) Transcript_66284:102-2063(+)
MVMLKLLTGLALAWLTVGAPSSPGGSPSKANATQARSNLRGPSVASPDAAPAAPNAAPSAAPDAAPDAAPAVPDGNVRSVCQSRPFDSSLGPNGGENMAQCQGDCDGDEDCAGGLMCKQRDNGESVPGCSGGLSWPQMDYCYDPQCEDDEEGLPPLDSSFGHRGSTDMPKCSGDCDEDGDCATGLKCYQRSGTTTVPGCSGTGVPDFDYCYDPADAPEPPTMPPGSGPACLCVFDVDRTLTGKQGTANKPENDGGCPADKEIYGIWDTAYRGGWLTISDAGRHLKDTFCSKCYMGIVSAGMASGRFSRERTYLLENVLVGEPFQALLSSNSQTSHWSVRSVHSPLVLGWPDGQKQDAVAGIVAWYEQQGIRIADEDVYFFGDRTENIPPFGSTSFNAREISCVSRDMRIDNGIVGYCGATVDEIVDTKGVHVCGDATPTPTPLPPPPATEDCLCIFDIDRTLTGKQEDLTSPFCDKNKVEYNIWDTAYTRGWLTLSEAAQTLPETFCNSCYLGVVSAGDAGGHTSPERPFLLENVLRSEKFDKMKSENSQASTWSDYPTVNSPLVLEWPNREKQDAAEGIVSWYAQQGVTIPPNKVHFFGDRTENIGPFAEKGYNAREISCDSRDYTLYSSGMVGLCGARKSEIVDTPGVAQC